MWSAVGVRDERERLVVPRVEPEIVRGQIDAAPVTHRGEGGGLMERTSMSGTQVIMKRVVHGSRRAATAADANLALAEA